MKELILVILTLVYCGATSQVPGEWTWMSGDSVPNSSGVFGTQGIPSSDNKPPGLYQSCGVTDKGGNFWLFGGTNFTDDGGVRTYNTLWKFDPVMGDWTWMKGLNGAYECGNYGTFGIPSQSNTPGSRYGAVMWSDPVENVLWLFGGYGDAACDANEIFGLLNDLWKYEIDSNQWVWIKGPKEADDLGVYGLKGKGDDFALPRARHQSNSWIDIDSNLWLFGGYNQQWGEYYNDLWKYDPTLNQWTWMKGDSFANQLGSYGTLGIPDSTNNPSARTCQAHWVDDEGDLWMFGGYGGFARDDLWEFEIGSNNWIWWGGTLPGLPKSNNGILCLVDSLNSPTPREQTGMIWASEENFWMFGGYGASITYGNLQAHNDLWQFYPEPKLWVRVFGDDYYTSGYFGSQGVSSSFNIPRSRFGGISWQDTSGNFWIFGGTYFIFTNFKSDCFNDLWRFVPDSTCGVFTSANRSVAVQEEILLFPNPASSQFFTQSNSSLQKSIIFVNQFGEVVMRGDFIVQAEFDVSPLPPGMYLVMVHDKSLHVLSVEKLLITR